jgi:hypothetical protein
VSKASEEWLSLLKKQPAMFSTMDAHKKPANFAWAFAANGEVWSSIDKVKAKDFKAPPQHLQVLLDGVNLFAWPAYMPGDELVDNVKDTVE